MKKLIVRLAGAAMALALVFGTMACESVKTPGEVKKEPKKTEKKKTARHDLPNYRYVDLDTLLTNYNLAKDYNDEMLRSTTNYENTAKQRQSAIQNKANNIQQKMQSNVYSSEASYNKDMEDFQKLQSNAENELARMQMQMQNDMMKAQQTVNDSIVKYIKEYNAAKGYDAIFMKAATLYIDEDLDITDEILEGLNARYNKVKK